MNLTRIHPLRRPLPRLGAVNRVPWVPSSATADIRHGQAIFYLTHRFDHEAALAKQRMQFLENEVVDLLAWTVPGGRVLDKDLEAVFRAWNPELEIGFTGNLLSRAVKAVTGLNKSYSNGKGYWLGFHLPTAEELERLALAA